MSRATCSSSTASTSQQFVPAATLPMTDRNKARSRIRILSLSSFIALGATVALVMTSGTSIFVVNAHSSHDSAMDASGSFALGDIHFESGHANGFSSAQTAAAQNQSLLWGVYRPNLYFGTRPRLPNSVMTGLMWFGTQDYSGLDNIRHGCEEGDKFEKYGWLKHDGRSFGVQQLKDTRNNVELTTDFIKIPGGEHGGSWGARISGKPIREGEPMSISAIYYMGLDGEGTFGLDKNNFVPISPIHFSGKTADLGDFEFTLEQTKGADSADRLHYAAMSLPQGSVWRAKDFAKEVMTQTAQVIQQSGPNRQFTPAQLFTLPNQFFGEGSNLLALQMNYDAEFEFEIRFNSKSSPNSATTKSMSQQLSKSIAAFDKRFEETFHLKEYGYSDSMVDFAKATMSNLIGGIGYFYGSSIVDESTTFEDGQNEHLEGPVARRPYPNPQMTAPASLFSAVPSRSFFPRGFYWDEGFHQSLMGQWDNDLSLDVIESWYNRQDSDGWIQREQILGDEARSRVPQEFQVQYPEHANPPTFLQAISCYIARLHNVSQTEFSVGSHGESASLNKDQDVTNARLLNRGLAKEYLTNLYPKLRTNYEWMRKTMQGKIREYGRRSHSRTEGYRWRGRTMTHTLTSGLDDYPRAPRPHVGELHVDLLSWIGFMGRNLQDIATLIGEEEDAEEFEEQYADIKANIHDLHWSEKDKAFCDVTVDEDEESVHVCHKGYISLFPMLLGIVEPKSDQLGHILDLMRDPEQMWSPYGLRSLSAKDEFFGTGENYWKGPIWINLNYLAVHSLKTHYLGKGPHQAKAKKIYNELRDNLIQNIYNEYERSGFVWEQYNDKTGHGQRSHPFTGWTSMVVLMMQMGRAH